MGPVTHTEAALRNIVTEPEDLPLLGQKFTIGDYSYNLAFHVGQT